jgi:hypothetical protein
MPRSRAARLLLPPARRSTRRMWRSSSCRRSGISSPSAGARASEAPSDAAGSHWRSSRRMLPPWEPRGAEEGVRARGCCPGSRASRARKARSSAGARRGPRAVQAEECPRAPQQGHDLKPAACGESSRGLCAGDPGSEDAWIAARARRRSGRGAASGPLDLAPGGRAGWLKGQRHDHDLVPEERSPAPPRTSRRGRRRAGRDAAHVPRGSDSASESARDRDEGLLHFVALWRGYPGPLPVPTSPKYPHEDEETLSVDKSKRAAPEANRPHEETRRGRPVVEPPVLAKPPLVCVRHSR